MLAGLALALQGCGGLAKGKALLPPPSLTAPCSAPMALPDTAMTQGQVEVAWGRDRSALRSCGGQLAGLVDWYRGQAQ